MSDQRGLPWPGVGLPISDPAGHNVRGCMETDDEHGINGEGGGRNGSELGQV
jgi:hypothetical protein